MSCSSARQAEMISRNTADRAVRQASRRVAGPALRAATRRRIFAFALGTVNALAALQRADLAHQRRAAVEQREQLRVDRVDFQAQLADFLFAHSSTGR